ncbi:hypothetical protein C1J03_05300 [Sulfitobacter sp. SK012]|uniref:peroxiredoxin family protein n=1 Tax=Sulfitobacter sp. SK012 TaxID=1389005 RepID=UPI000E0C5BAA|nr:redoxin family protein [Sulfitobacter sp. SK012]AXI45504.1 hypothetical protein C1J03_05300 [Sulfitobacter sp. SK012]
MNSSHSSTGNIIPKASSKTNEEYRYKTVNLGLFLQDGGFSKSSAVPGDTIPPFELVTTNGDHLTNSDVFNDKPVLFIFGSLTCPMTTSSTPDLLKTYEEFGDQIDFIMMQVREAHPGELIPQPDTMEQKMENARSLKEFFNIPWTVAADNIDGDLHRALDPKPNSIFLADKNGVILFRSLWAGDDTAVHQAIEAVAAGKTLSKTQSTSGLAPIIEAFTTYDETLKRGGPQAVKDMWRSVFPAAMTAHISTYFTPLSPKKRGYAAVLTLAVVLGAFGYIILT